MQRIYLLILLIPLSLPAYALDELVDSAWLNANKTSDDLLLLDIQKPEQYKLSHIAGAINAPYEQWRTGKESKMPGRLPSITQMERFLGRLGISNDSRLVVIATGNQPSDMAAASRVFWTLKVLGHQEIAILNGGLTDYAIYFPRDVEATPRSRPSVSYKSKPDYSFVATSKGILSVLQENTQLLDARTLGEYSGVVTAKPNERPGTIPGAKHLPFDWMVNTHGHIRDKHEVITLYQATRLNPDQDSTVHFCHSGNRASLTWFVDYAILGHRNAKLYDASMMEWATQEKLPIQARIKF